jgi:hypothetical protein
MLEQLLKAYAEIVQAAPSAEAAAAHLAALLNDVEAVHKAVQDAIEAARQRAGQP